MAGLTGEDPSRYERGLEVVRSLGAAPGPAPAAGLDRIAPGLERLIIEYGFGDILTRPALSLRDREAAIVVTLAVLGRHAALERHIPYVLNLGMTREQVVELLMQTSIHAGFPVAEEALVTAAQVFERIDAEDD